MGKKYYWIILSIVIVSCGGASETGSSSTSSTDSGSTTNSDGTIETDTTVSALLSGGVQVEDVSETLAGTTWRIKTYDLDSTAETITAESTDEAIEFSEDGSVASLVKFLNAESDGLTDFSVPPLYDYEVGAYINAVEQEGEETRYDDCLAESDDDWCDCGEGDVYCVVEAEEGSNINYCVAHTDENEQVVAGLWDAQMTYGVSGIVTRPTLEFNMTGTAYNGCCSDSPGGCASDYDEDHYNQPTEVVRTTEFEIEAITQGLMAIETDDSYIVLVKE